MTTTIVVLAIVVGITIGLKVYLEEKDLKKVLEEQKAKQAEIKSNEQIVSERLAEIEDFEKQVAEVVETAEVATPVPAQKKTSKKKKYYAPKKTQSKIKK